MIEKIQMIATQKQRFGRARLEPGDPLLATPREAKTLIALRRAERAPQVAALLQAKPLEADVGVYENRAMTAEQPRAAGAPAERVKRPYRRREASVA